MLNIAWRERKAPKGTNRQTGVCDTLEADQDRPCDQNEGRQMDFEADQLDPENTNEAVTVNRPDGETT